MSREKQMEFYRSEKVSSTTTRIFGVAGELMYLVEGSHTAMLLDGGVGMGDLAAYVASLTNLPVKLLLTHGHMDHTGAAPLFGNAFLNEKDWVLAEKHARGGDKYKRESASTLGFQEKDIVPYRNVRYLPLKDGDTFDLGGGVTLQALEMPGHTQGSMTILLPHEQSILLGDACNTLTFMFDENASTIADYLACLQNFVSKHRGLYNRVYLSHGSGDTVPHIVEEVIDVCTDIIRGNTSDTAFSFMGQSCWIAKPVDENTMKRVDGKSGNIVYNKRRVL